MADLGFIPPTVAILAAFLIGYFGAKIIWELA